MQQLLQMGGPGAFSTIVNTSIPLLRGDFSLNAANVISVNSLLRHGKLDRITPTHDLNSDQIVEMANLMNQVAQNDGITSSFHI